MRVDIYNVFYVKLPSTAVTLGRAYNGGGRRSFSSRSTRSRDLLQWAVSLLRRLFVRMLEVASHCTKVSAPVQGTRVSKTLWRKGRRARECDTCSGRSILTEKHSHSLRDCSIACWSPRTIHVFPLVSSVLVAQLTFCIAHSK